MQLCEKLVSYSKSIYFRVLFFRFLLECFFEIFLAAFLNSYSLSAVTFGDWLNSMLTIATLLVCFNLPLLVILLVVHQRKLNEEAKKDFWRKYGVFFEGVDTKRYGAILVCTIFFLRRIAFVLIAGLMVDSPLL